MRGSRRRNTGRNALGLTLATAFAVAGLAGPAAASPDATPDAGFFEIDCGGQIGTVWIAGGGSGLGFGEDGTVWRRQEGRMRGLEGGFDCHGTPVVRIR